MFALFVAEQAAGYALYLGAGVYLAREADWDMQGKWYRWPALAGTAVAWPLVVVALLLYVLIYD